jgi:hypothetical protein
MKACARAKDLLETNGNSKLGKGTSTNMKSKVIRFTKKVDSAVDENEVCSWKQEHFDKLYISVPDGGAKDNFIGMVENMKLCTYK